MQRQLNNDPGAGVGPPRAYGNPNNRGVAGAGPYAGAATNQPPPQRGAYEAAMSTDGTQPFAPGGPPPYLNAQPYSQPYDTPPLVQGPTYGEAMAAQANAPQPSQPGRMSMAGVMANEWERQSEMPYLMGGGFPAQQPPLTDMGNIQVVSTVPGQGPNTSAPQQYATQAMADSPVMQRIWRSTNPTEQQAFDAAVTNVIEPPPIIDTYEDAQRMLANSSYVQGMNALRQQQQPPAQPMASAPVPLAPPQQQQITPRQQAANSAYVRGMLAL